MWQQSDNQLTRTFKFKNFAEALAFVTEVGAVAESQGHHPTIILSWGSVIVTTTTHDQGNLITDKDIKLTAAVDKIQLK